MKSGSSSISFYTKIQEAQPSYYSTLINKELALDVNIEFEQQTYKVKNCIDSSRSNSDLYKRFSKPFVESIGQGIDQMLVFCGSDVLARLETSIGMKRNPGIFMICGIGVLDDKYQHQFVNYDVQASFMEYVDGNFYDLLTRTNRSLKMTRKDDNLAFGETYIKVNTFSQFLKLFKIALFHNQQRDPNQNIPNRSLQQQLNVKTRSTFIMSLQTRKYNGNQSEVQKTVFIDFGSSDGCSSRNVWEYFMIELNNLTTKKKMYYHLIQPNPLLCLMKSFLVKGRTIILYSFSANPERFKENFEYIEQLREIAETSVGTELVKKKQNGNFEKKYQKIKEKLMDLRSQICDQNYKSLRSFREMREQCKKIIDEIKGWINKTVKNLAQMIQNKRTIKMVQHEIIYDEIELIGSCVKSDHYKDFYTAKTYISLQREVQIKTEGLRNDLENLYRNRDELQEKFTEIRFKQKLQYGEFEDFMAILRSIGASIYDFFLSMFMQIVYDFERTVMREVMKEIEVKTNGEMLIRLLREFMNSLYEFKKESKIVSTDGTMKDAHLCMLVREINQLGVKNQRKRKNLQQQHAIFKSKPKFLKLPTIEQKCINIVGSFKLQELLVEPLDNV